MQPIDIPNKNNKDLTKLLLPLVAIGAGAAGIFCGNLDKYLGQGFATSIVVEGIMNLVKSPTHSKENSIENKTTNYSLPIHEKKKLSEIEATSNLTYNLKEFMEGGGIVATSFVGGYCIGTLNNLI